MLTAKYDKGVTTRGRVLDFGQSCVLCQTATVLWVCCVPVAEQLTHRHEGKFRVSPGMTSLSPCYVRRRGFKTKALNAWMKCSKCRNTIRQITQLSKFFDVNKIDKRFEENILKETLTMKQNIHCKRTIRCNTGHKPNANWLITQGHKRKTMSNLDAFICNGSGTPQIMNPKHSWFEVNQKAGTLFALNNSWSQLLTTDMQLK